MLEIDIDDESEAQNYVKSKMVGACFLDRLGQGITAAEGAPPLEKLRKETCFVSQFPHMVYTGSYISLIV